MDGPGWTWSGHRSGGRRGDSLIGFARFSESTFGLFSNTAEPPEAGRIQSLHAFRRASTTKKRFPLKHVMFFKETEQFTTQSNLEGGSQTFSIRIFGRHLFRVFSSSYEKRFSLKIQCFSRRLNNFLPNRTRRGETRRSLSESVVHTFSMFSRHLQPESQK